MNDEKKAMTPQEAAQNYLYPILKTVNVNAPLTGLDLERAFLAGYDWGMISQFSQEQLEAYRSEILKTIENAAKSQQKLELVKSDA